VFADDLTGPSGAGMFCARRVASLSGVRAAAVAAAALGSAGGISCAMRIEEEVKLDYKDVLLRPKRSTLASRSQVWRERRGSVTEDGPGDAAGR
jgi:hypothetical protein